MSFIKTSGTKFTLDGNLFIPFGGSLYNSSIPQSNSTLDSRISEAVAANFNMVRLINYLPAVSTAGIEYSETYWTAVDYCLSICRKNSIKVSLDLSDYANILSARVSGQQWTYDWSAFLSYVANRVNTVNGLTYKNDDTLALISLLGEPSPPSDAALLNFYTTVSAIAKVQFPNHLIGAGGIEWYNTNYPLIYAIPTMDWLGTHPYDSNLGSDLAKAFYVSLYASQAVANNKPFIFEEFGWSQNVGDAQRATHMTFIYQMGKKSGCAGFLFWNFNPGYDGGAAYNIGNDPGMIQTYRTVKLFSYLKDRSPDLPIDWYWYTVAGY